MKDTHHVSIGAIRNMQSRTGRNIAFATMSGRDSLGRMVNGREAAIFDDDLVAFVRKHEGDCMAVHIEVGERGNVLKDAEIETSPAPTAKIEIGERTIREWIDAEREAFGFYFNWHLVDFMVAPVAPRGEYPAEDATVPWLVSGMTVNAGRYRITNGPIMPSSYLASVAFGVKYGIDSKVCPDLKKWAGEQYKKWDLAWKSKEQARERLSNGAIPLF